MPFILLAIEALFLHFLREHQREKKRSAAITLWVDLSEKVQDLIDDPFTTDTDWRMLLPVLEYADTCTTFDQVRLSFLAKTAKIALQIPDEGTPV